MRPRDLVFYYRNVGLEKGFPYTRLDATPTQREFDRRAEVRNTISKQVSVSCQTLFAEHAQLAVPNRHISIVTGWHPK